MTTADELAFAPWVAPIARAHRDVRSETLRLARALSDADLARATGDTGWSTRDEFVHIAASESNVLKVLRAITGGETPDLSFFNDLDANNARVLAAEATRSMRSVTDDLDQHGRDLQAVLARLTADDESRQVEGLPFPIGQLVAGYEGHEPYHLGQIRAALDRPADAGSARFAPWVEPIAAAHRDHRAEIVGFARSLDAEAWDLPSPDAGWTCRDLLAHVAGDTGKNLHAGLRAIIAQQSLSPALFTEFDERNARDVADRRARSINELIAELEADGDETQRLLAQLRPDAGGWRIEGLRGTLAEALDALAQHDVVHLAQLRAATGTIRESAATV